MQNAVWPSLTSKNCNHPAPAKGRKSSCSLQIAPISAVFEVNRPLARKRLSSGKIVGNLRVL